MAFADGKSHTLEQKRTTDQGTFYYEITGSPLRNAEGTIVAGIELVRDVTERMKLLDQLEAVTGSLAVRVQEEVEKNRAREQVMQIQNRHAAMGEMIDNIAHQWRQPLNNLGLIMQNIKNKFRTGTLTPEKMEEQAKLGMSLISYMSQTISDFTHFLRHDKTAAKFRIKDVVATALTVAGTSLKRNAVTVITGIDDDMTVMGYRNEYTQVVVNILNNARDIFVERGIQKPVITLRACREDHTSVLTITDNGGGITPPVMQKIFTPNFTTKAPYRGTGIGLYMSKIIIEKNMQGRLSVRNAGEGAEFKIEVRHGG
jgi:C4-dicarboxylate-specific signal transduction histidine kinase